MYRIVICAVLFISSAAWAERTWIGRNTVAQISYVDASDNCGPSGSPCLLIYFEGGALGCNPSSNYIAVSTNDEFFKQFEALSLVSITSKKKLKTYGTVESCKSAIDFNPNGVTLFDAEIW